MNDNQLWNEHGTHRSSTMFNESSEEEEEANITVNDFQHMMFDLYLTPPVLSPQVKKLLNITPLIYPPKLKLNSQRNPKLRSRSVTCTNLTQTAQRSRQSSAPNIDHFHYRCDTTLWKNHDEDDDEEEEVFYDTNQELELEWSQTGTSLYMHTPVAHRTTSHITRNSTSTPKTQHAQFFINPGNKKNSGEAKKSNKIYVEKNKIIKTTRKRKRSANSKNTTNKKDEIPIKSLTRKIKQLEDTAKKRLQIIRKLRKTLITKVEQTKTLKSLISCYRDTVIDHMNVSNQTEQTQTALIIDYEAKICNNNSKRPRMQGLMKDAPREAKLSISQTVSLTTDMTETTDSSQENILSATVKEGSTESATVKETPVTAVVKDTAPEVTADVTEANAEATISKLSQEFSELAEMKKSLDDKYKSNIRRLHLEHDRLQQYSMRDSIKICGVPYKVGEDTNMLVTRISNSLGVSISEHDISVSHRTGKTQGNNPRPIVAKFTRRATKHAILYNKSFAKNITTDDDGNPVKIYVDEQLTPMRGKVCKRLRERRIQYNTRDGKIIYSTEGSDKIILDFPEDWERLGIPVSEKEELGIFPKF